MSVSSRRALEEVAAQAAPHLGHVSLEHGMLAPAPLPAALPASHAAWDELAMALPALWSDVGVRSAVGELPALAAGPDDLPDDALWRASVTLGAIAYSYVRCDLHHLHERAPLPIPAHVLAPWTTVATRMGRETPHLAYDDIVTVNWRLREGTRAPGARVEDLRLEDLRLAVPLQGNGAELQFLGANIEIAAQLAPVVGATVRAQEAVVREDRDALVTELLAILERLRHVTDVSLMKIDPNAHSGRFADPVVWAKLVAPTGIPIVQGVPGVSGAGAAALQLVDAFLGRTQFQTMLGGEALHTRAWYSPNVRRFLDAIEEVSVRSYVGAHDDPRLAGVFASVVNAYAGDRGYLGAHRRKVYGFIQTAFKAGRPATASGISGGFSTRTWRTTIGHLEDARRERYEELITRPQIAPLAAREPVGGDRAGIQRVTLDVSRAGVVYRPGDRLAVLPAQSDALVARTLRALRARGDEPVPLGGAWRAAIRAHTGEDAPEQIPLRELLRAARLRPLARDAGKILAELSGSQELARILEAREEDQRELWDAIELAAAAGYDPRRMWRAPLWRDESLSRIVAPAQRRMYSISGAPDGIPFPSTVTLTVGPLSFRSPGPAGADEPGSRSVVGTPWAVAQTGSAEDSGSHRRRGAGSSFLAADAAALEGVDVQVVRPTRFRLPDDASVPIVMFAGGTGIAPFVGFLEERVAASGVAESAAGPAEGGPAAGGPCWLFAGARTVAELPYRDRLARLAADDRVHVRTAISREAHDGMPARRIDAVIAQEENAAQLRALLAGDGVFYICGQAAFANTVIDALAAVAGPGERGRAAIRRLVGEGRLMSDLFTTFASSSAPGVRGSGTFDVSDLVLRNDDEHGWWLAVNGAVYDMTEFRHLHPGGFRIIDDNAGCDATDEYRAVEHHEDSEIEAMLAMYKVGFLRRYDLGSAWGVALQAKGIRYVSLHDLFTAWVRHLYLVVEMQNALRNDFSFLESALAQDDAADVLTRLKLMLAGDAQGRFLGMYVPDATGPAIEELWELSCGLLDAHADPLELARRLRALAHGGAGVAARAGTERFRERVAARALDPRGAGALLADLRATDAALLAGIKGHLREGVVAFQTHQGDLLDSGDTTLLRVLTGVGDEVQAFYVRLANAWERHGITTG